MIHYLIDVQCWTCGRPMSITEETARDQAETHNNRNYCAPCLQEEQP